MNVHNTRKEENKEADPATEDNVPRIDEMDFSFLKDLARAGITCPNLEAIQAGMSFIENES